jgi:hypothetical protein
MAFDVQLFHILKDREHLVILRMELDGQYMLYLPGNRSLEQTWPYYPDARPYLDLWFSRYIGQPVGTLSPGDPEYPRQLAQILTQDPYLNMWAYVTPQVIRVSFRQIAQALGRDPKPTLRDELTQKGLRFERNESGHYQAPLGIVTRALGPQVADRLLLYPQQVAAFLGVTPGGAPDITRRLGLLLEGRGDIALVEWGRLRQVRRTGPRTFVLTEGEKEKEA